MNARCSLVLGVAVAVACVFLLASAPAFGSAVPPGSSYVWSQPGTAPVSVPFAQPPAWILGAFAPTLPPTSSYGWGQPGTAPVNTPDAQPPAWIPTD